jgi:FdrA protein
MIVRSAVKRSAYFDSVTLMLAQREVRAQPGVEEAGMVLATETNRALLREAGLLPPDAEAAGPDDLVISVRAHSEGAAVEALAFAERTLTQRRQAAAAGGAYRPRTIASARRLLPGATLAAISVPGRYAGAVAREALGEGLHVFLFSDNVPLEAEVALKALAAARGLLLMGPDCGTALLGGVGLGFANSVRRGRVGLVAAAGTGLQEVASLIHRSGGGVSHAIGTGGRDATEAVGGAAMLRGIAALAADPATAVIVLIAKLPHPAVAGRLLGAARVAGKPVVLAFVGARVPSSGHVVGVETLEDAAAAAVRLAGEGDGEVPSSQALPAQEAGRLLPAQQYLRGLYSGGTLCAETQALLHPSLGRIFSNAPLRPQDRVKGTAPARAHTVLDMGADEFTQGRLHPMIDPALRLQRLDQEAADPDVGVLLLDVVLGFGADRDPAGTLAPAVADARRRALEAGRYLCVVGSLCGTDGDPQDFRAQEAALLEAGMVLEGSNARAARLAGRILVGRGARNDASASGPGDETAPLMEVEPEETALPDPGEIPRLLSTQPQVINVGLELFAESLTAQHVPVIHLDWRPPAGGKKHLQDLLERLEA